MSRVFLTGGSGRLRAFVNTNNRVMDVRDVVDAHLLAGDPGRSRRRDVLNGATIICIDALQIVSNLSGVQHELPRISRALARGAARRAGLRLAVARVVLAMLALVVLALEEPQAGALVLK